MHRVAREILLPIWMNGGNCGDHGVDIANGANETIRISLVLLSISEISSTSDDVRVPMIAWTCSFLMILSTAMPNRMVKWSLWVSFLKIY